MKTSDDKSIIQFLRTKSYEYVRDLGQGACGRTVLLRDPHIGLEIVCKKYAPANEQWREQLFEHFVREIRLLYQLHHANVVRLFQHYIYEEQKAGFILMEYVPGLPIDEHLRRFPEQINGLFEQAIEGFRHLEIANVLHRDIRPGNILVRDDGQLKIIDLGFGKQITTSADFGKSVSLNWWCDLPEDFSDGRYDFSTEVYFVGKLFQGSIRELEIENFEYKDVLAQMCEFRAEQRLKAFSNVYQHVSRKTLSEIGFSDQERAAYVAFADALEASIFKISTSAKYVQDTDKAIRLLEEAYRSFLLEDFVPDASKVTRCFLQGTHYTQRRRTIHVHAVAEFLRLLRSVPVEKRNIILANLRTRLDSIARFSEDEDEIPF